MTFISLWGGCKLGWEAKRGGPADPDLEEARYINSIFKDAWLKGIGSGGQGVGEANVWMEGRWFESLYKQVIWLPWLLPAAYTHTAPSVYAIKDRRA